MQETKELDLVTLCKMLIKHMRLIIIFVLLFGMASFAITKFLIHPQYTASVSIYVNNSRDTTTDRINSTDLTASQQLVNTYITIIKSESVIGQVIEASQLPYTVKDVQKMMTASAIDNTEIFRVNIENTNPENARLLANTIADVAPRIIMDYVEGSSVKVVDYAKLPHAPSSPSVVKNTLIGVLLGIILSIGLSLMLEMFNNRITSEEDLDTMFSIPVLGVIPEFLSHDKKYGSYEYGGYGYGHSAKKTKRGDE